MSTEDDLKYRIAYYYGKNGRPDALASELSCMDAMCLFNWRLRGMEPAAEKWLFLMDFTLTVKQDASGRVSHVGPLANAQLMTGDPWPSPEGTPDFLEALSPFAAPTPEAALLHIKQVIAEQGMAVIACADERIGVFISSLRPGEQRMEGHAGHVFAIVAVSGDEIHYVDTPLYIIRSRYVPHPRHRGIGVMKVEDFLPALADGYHLISLVDAPLHSLPASFPVGQLQRMARHHHASIPSQAHCWVGDLAYAKLIESLQDGGIDLLEALPGKYVGAARRIDYLDWKCFEMLNMRRSWLRACQARALQTEGGDELAVILAESVQLWKSLSTAVCVPRDPELDGGSLRATVRGLFADARELDRRLFDHLAAGAGHDSQASHD
jgi:hypothetical protein